MTGEVHFLQSEPSQNLHFIAARDIMAPDVICFREVTIISLKQVDEKSRYSLQER